MNFIRLQTLFATSAAVMILAAGCNLLNPTPATDWPGRSETLTALAPLNLTETIPSPEGTEAAGASVTPAPLESPAPTSPPADPTARPQPSPTQAPCYAAELVKDVTIPDGTVLAPGKSFIKTWQLWNTGSCSWPATMLVAFDSGTQLAANTEYKLGKTVASGEVTNVSVPMTAPLTAGEFTSNWRLKPQGGTPFGVGAANVPFYAKIKVGDTFFTVTDVTISADPGSASASCPPGYTFRFTAQITATGPGVVTYRWFFGESSLPDESITFTGAGAQTVSTTWTVSSTTTGTAGIYIVQPNRQSFTGGGYSLTCQ